MNEYLERWISQIPGYETYGAHMLSATSVLLIFLTALVSYFITKRVLVYLINKQFERSKSNLDDILVKRRIFNRMAYVVPAAVIYKLIPSALADYPFLSSLITNAMAIFLVLAVTLVVDALINSISDIYRTFEVSKRVPIQSFVQVAKLVVYFIALITIAALVLNESPTKLFAGLGAMTAVLMLVFKDPILGFVAGLQLSYNRMVQIGDWVEVPQHNADGDILEIGLTTVKVRNFDNTITTVPTQSLINESFKNWRGMQESPGRRIKRSLYIDINSIRFCDETTLERYAKIDYISEYISAKKDEVEKHNQAHVANKEQIVNGRRLTNIGTFRAYILAYLQNHPNINQDLTVMVRQLAATESGVPLQVYAFSAVKDWAVYESIQADIFDHLFAVAKEFDLEIYQKPSGVDLTKIRSAI